MSKNLTPAEVFPPMDFIREEMESRGWSQGDLASLANLTDREVEEILKSDRPITDDQASKLATAFGVSPAMFIKLSNSYHGETVIRLKEEDSSRSL